MSNDAPGYYNFSPTNTSTANRMSLNGATLAYVQRNVNAPPASLAFVAAINDCTRVSNLPHPIHARRANVVTTWQRWAAFREAKVKRPMAGQMMAGLQFSFDMNVMANEEVLNDDPVWRSGHLVKPKDMNFLATSATAPLMFWHRPHVMIEMTPALESLLDRSDLGPDIPLDQLRPPKPACYIRFGEIAQKAIAPSPEGANYGRIEGAYIFEAMNGGRRAVTVVAVYEVGQRLAISNIELIINDERRPINDLIECMTNSGPAPVASAHHQTLVQLCMKVFLYWNTDQAIRREEFPYSDAAARLERLGPKKAAKVGRHVDGLYDRVLLGPLALVGGEHGGGGEKQTHWRRGHFRLQAHGPQLSLRKVIFIAPVLVRADRQLSE